MFEAFSCSIHPCVRVTNARKAKRLPLIVQDKEHVCDMHSFVQGPLPPLSSLVDILTSLPGLPQLPFFDCLQNANSAFAYCKQSNLDGRKAWERDYDYIARTCTYAIYTHCLSLIFDNIQAYTYLILCYGAVSSIS